MDAKTLLPKKFRFGIAPRTPVDVLGGSDDNQVHQHISTALFYGSVSRKILGNLVSGTFLRQKSKIWFLLVCIGTMAQRKR